MRWKVCCLFAFFTLSVKVLLNFSFACASFAFFLSNAFWSRYAFIVQWSHFVKIDLNTEGQLFCFFTTFFFLLWWTTFVVVFLRLRLFFGSISIYKKLWINNRTYSIKFLSFVNFYIVFSIFLRYAFLYNLPWMKNVRRSFHFSISNDFIGIVESSKLFKNIRKIYEKWVFISQKRGLERKFTISNIIFSFVHSLEPFPSLFCE
jgi:hypothetical protein